MDDRAAVLEANAAFYRAFESLDLARMEAVWLRAPYIKCVHPGVEVSGDLAWVVVTENLESHHRDGKTTAQVQATNVFERRDGRWYLVHHHGSPIYPPLADLGPERMH